MLILPRKSISGKRKQNQLVFTREATSLAVQNIYSFIPKYNWLQGNDLSLSEPTSVNSFVIFFHTLSNPLLFIQLLILSVYLLIRFRGSCCGLLSTLALNYCWHQHGLRFTESAGSQIQICKFTRVTKLTPFLFGCET